MEKKYIVRLSDAERSELKEVIRTLNGTMTLNAAWTGK
jgi:hypothetical protein